MPIYLKARLEGSRSCRNECASFKQPFDLVSCNEQKVIARTRRHAFLQWDRLQVDLQYTFEVPKLALVKLTFSHIL
jgi:hypothetical protein